MTKKKIIFVRYIDNKLHKITKLTIKNKKQNARANQNLARTK